jgi:hypothetical protein
LISISFPILAVINLHFFQLLKYYNTFSIGMPVSVPGFPGLVPEYFALFSLIPRDFLGLITTNLSLRRHKF